MLPVIVASVRARDDDVDLGGLVDDHAELARLLAEIERALPRFAADVANAGPLAAGFTRLADLLDEHIVDEEAQAFPVVLEYVSAEDFARCEEMFRRGVPPGQLLLFTLPWVLDHCAAEEPEALLADLPAPLRPVLRLGERRYARLRDAVQG